MHADTPKEKPTVSGNPTAGHTDSAIVPDTASTDKLFATLRAQFALRGHALHRTSHADGPVAYYSERWGLVRFLPTLHDAELFLAQIGGAHE